MADSATQRRPRGGFSHAATKIAAGAPIAGIRSQAKSTTAVKLWPSSWTTGEKMRELLHSSPSISFAATVQRAFITPPDWQLEIAKVAKSRDPFLYGTVKSYV
jgi:hypothetical protein